MLTYIVYRVLTHTQTKIRKTKSVIRLDLCAKVIINVYHRRRELKASRKASTETIGPPKHYSREQKQNTGVTSCNATC